MDLIDEKNETEVLTIVNFRLLFFLLEKFDSFI
jgi:hypothetical protein